jgi:hypothetical protein
MRKVYLILILGFLSILIIAIVSSPITYRFRNLTSKYSTDFEDITKIDPSHSSIPISHNFWFGGTVEASFWIEGLDRNVLPTGITPHSGTRCIGMEIPSGTIGEHRAEFNIMNLNSLVGKALNISCWLFLPTTLSLTVTDSWYSMGDAFMTSGTDLPYVAFLLERPYVNGNYRFYMGYRDTSGTMNQLGTIQPFNLSSYLGAWHHLEYYVYLDTGTNGKVKYWLDGILLFDITGIQTKNPAADWFTTPAKIYYTTTDTSGPFRVWIDDLQLESE